MSIKNNLYPVRDTKDLKTMLRECAELYGNKEAFLVKVNKGGEYREISYKKFKDDVDSLGTKLMEMGMSGKKIAIIGLNSYQWVVAYFAVICGVGIAVPLDKELKEEEVKNLVEISQCSAAFSSPKFLSYFENSSVKEVYEIDMYENPLSVKPGDKHIQNLIDDGRKLIESGDMTFLNAKIDEDKMTEILFTSGTTGRPKGVMLSHKNLLHVVKSTSQIVNLSTEDRTLSLLPIHHTFESTLGILTILYQGASTAFCEGLKYILKNMMEAKISVLVAVPLIVETIYNKIWKEAEKSRKSGALRKAISLNKTLKTFGIDKSDKIFKSVYKNFGGRFRTVICGAAAINPNVVKGFLDMGFTFLQGYGLTETAPLAAGTPDFVNVGKKPGSCGPAIPGVEIKIEEKDEDGIGEIYLKGDNVMLGYYEMPEETAAVLDAEGWFKTGDLGFLDNEGWLYITGRSKNVIVTNTGKNIYPEEIENLINNIGIVKDSMVYGLQEEGGNDYIVAVQIIPEYEIIEENKGELSEEEIYELFREDIYELNKKLPSYKRIKNIRIRKNDFIRTTTKKIKRQENL